MKSKLFFLAVVLFSFAGLKSQAQFKLGGGLAFGSNHLNLGISANGLYSFNEKWEAAPSFTYYFAEEYTSGWSLDLAGHYVFSADDQKAFYALGGLEVLGYSVDAGGWSSSGSDFGVILGAGGRLELNDKLTGFGEAKLGIVNDTYIGFNVGVLFSL